jgi:hypothetical protein
LLPLLRDIGDAILTMNAKDFPGNLLAEEDSVPRRSSTGFLLRLHDEAPQVVSDIAHRLGRGEPVSPEP